MNTGDMVIATWPDGLEIEGKYVGFMRGCHIIVSGSQQERVVCGPATKLEKKNVESEKKKV